MEDAPAGDALSPPQQTCLGQLLQAISQDTKIDRK